MKYVNSMFDLGLVYKRDTKFLLRDFTDADFGRDLDDQRSTSGYVFSCDLVSKKHDSVSLCTSKAEYKTSSFAVQECV